MDDGRTDGKLHFIPTESFISTRRKASFHPEMDVGRMDDGMTGQDG
jgi:hypothetical protein